MKKTLPYIKKVLVAGIIVLLVIALLSSDWLFDFLNDASARLGAFAPSVIVLYVVISHVLAPVTGSPAVVASAAVYGINATLVYLYIGGLISSVINFYISRKLGRRWVEKLAGKKSMENVDRFMEMEGTKTLIASRIFGFPLFDVVSYAAGLTNVSFRKYYLITAVFSIIPKAAYAIIFQDINVSSKEGFALWIGSIFLAGVIFSFTVKKYMDYLKYRKDRL